MRLTFPNGEHSTVELSDGEVSIGSGAENAIRVPGVGLAPTHAHLSIGNKGLWLRVAPEAGAVHVNARPVHALAMLRAGDLLCLGHLQAQVCATGPANALAGGRPGSRAGDVSKRPSVVLRGVSGAYSGRSFSVGDGLVLGTGAEADVSLDDPALSDTRVEISAAGGEVHLAVQGEEPVRVNGLACHGGVLLHGDQLLVEQYRFVLEAPGLDVKRTEVAAQPKRPEPEPAAPARADPGTTVWWLIAAALSLAAVLTALLLYGPGR